jgi:hypothetical protein
VTTGDRELPTRLLYRNPLEILLAEEARTCKGCASEHTETIWGKTITICTSKNEKGQRRNHGRRCKAYQEETIQNEQPSRITG